MLNIIQKPSPNFGERNGFKPEIIVLHIMAGSLTGTDSWFATSESQVSSHYGIGFTGEIHQYVPEEKKAWTQGLKIPPINKPLFKLYKQGVNPNDYCIGIEHEGEDLSIVKEAEINASVELIKDIAKRWNIPIDRDHIIGHYEVDPIRKPNCPATDKSIIDRIVRMAQEPKVVVAPTLDKEKIKQAISLLQSLLV